MDPLITPPESDHQHVWCLNVTGAWYECTVPGCIAMITELERRIAAGGGDEEAESEPKPPTNAELDALAQPRMVWRGPEINRKGYRKLIAQRTRKDRRKRKRLKKHPPTG